MKSLVVAVSLFVVSYSNSAQALFTACEMRFNTQSWGFIIDGGGGQGDVVCWDVTGQAFQTYVDIGFIGAGSIGYCQMGTRMAGIGPGFALDDFLSLMGQVDLGLVFGGGYEVGLGGRLSPAGINVQLYANSTYVNGPCASLVRGKFMWSHKISPTRRIYRAYPGYLPPPPPCSRCGRGGYRQAAPPPPAPGYYGQQQARPPVRQAPPPDHWGQQQQPPRPPAPIGQRGNSRPTTRRDFFEEREEMEYETCDDRRRCD